jgi:hypothetical protein
MSYSKSPAPKPSAQEIARGLMGLGLTSSAKEILHAIGMKDLPEEVVEKPKYVREKNRSAFIYANVQATPDQQKMILESFTKQVVASNAWAPALEKALVEIVLPKAKVVYAYRLPLKEYSSSNVPELLAKSRVLAAYTRKPRSDAQHHKQTRSN